MRRGGSCGKVAVTVGERGMCGRPMSWSTASSWRVPLPLCGNALVATDAGTAKFPSHNSSLIESSCEEEVSAENDGCPDNSSHIPTKNSDSKAPTRTASSESKSRLKAKVSLDETVRNSAADGFFDGDNFTRSDVISRTPGGVGSEGPACRLRGTGVPRTALARSSSYQALHSALARLYRLDDFATERLGQGFFSEVYKVRHRVTGDVMVLKMNKLVSNRHNMLKEVQLMNRLHHPNILAYHGVCIHEGQVHALTEYISGGSLDVMLQDRSVEISWVARVSLAADIARGMTYLHSQGVFHRDLTSKNVLIKELGAGVRKKREAVVADFGLAAPIPRDKSVRMSQVGSPYWMAPEVVRGEWYDHRADVFSFGIILCEMIARCEADPDVLPRTNNFGVHYLAFSRMCQNDCPPYFLQMAFQCCQIDPSTRFSFEELTKNFEWLLNKFMGHRASSAMRKQKVCHRRSLSDDCLMLGRSNSSGDEVSCGSSLGSHGSGGSSVAPSSTAAAEMGRTPQEVVERMGAADPYFSPSTATVNPFTRVKLPAPSRLTVGDGARFCHSLPDPLPSKPSAHNGQHSSSSHLTRAAVAATSTRAPLPHHHGSHTSLSHHTHDPSGRSSLLLRQDGGSGGGGGGAHGQHLVGAIKRRGSGESGFFSVGDMERTGTPDQWLSYSELSSTSLAYEDEERSWVTDSSEDLCGQEEPDTHEPDIKAIVEFFENGYGSLRSGPLIGRRSSRLSPRSPASPPHLHGRSASSRPSSKIAPRCVSSRRDTFRIKDRPKMYITEGIVRAKRDLFEPK